MRPLERSLEKLDNVRKKKLAEMIAGSGSGGTSSGVYGFLCILTIAFSVGTLRTLFNWFCVFVSYRLS